MNLTGMVVLRVEEDGSQSKLGVLLANMGHRMLDRNHPYFKLSCTSDNGLGFRLLEEPFSKSKMATKYQSV